MTTPTWLLGDNPKWYFADLTGKPLGAGSMATFRSLDKTQQKFVFQDPGGNFPWPDPVLIDENGTQGPFYWATDEAYYIEVYDSMGVLQWTIDGYTPTGSGGGVITEAFNFLNLVVNNVFWRCNFNPASPITITPTENLLLAPGAHSNFASSTQPGNQPDIRFVKNNLSATDFLTFVPFTLGDASFTPDVTPPLSLRYQCTAIGAAGETSKQIQFPISTDIQSTSNQATMISIWAKCAGGANTLTVFYSQFFGDGAGASAIQTSIAEVIPLTSSWARYDFSMTIPDVTGMTLGACKNTGLYFNVQYPLNSITDIYFALPSAYLGTVLPNVDYLTNDQIDAVINAPRTGDIRTSLNTFQPFGWVPANDGTIGNPSSNASTRANYDTFPLYDAIWNNASSVSLVYAPIFDSSGNATTLGASSTADFIANKQLALTKMLGNVCAGTSPTVPAAQFVTLDHTTLTFTATNTIALGAVAGTPVIYNTVTGSVPTGLVTGGIYYVFNTTITTFQLALTLDDAIAGNSVVFTSNGSGTSAVGVYAAPLGLYQGQASHLLIPSELPDPLTTTADIATVAAGGGPSVIVNSAAVHSTGAVSNLGGNQYHNNMQPTTFMNVFFKL